MIIQHNIPALNSHRNLGINNSATAKNLEKLSSGFRINRAGDDAAGLAISEKMRGQIRGLAMAEQNASNGISLIQTAEGGLNETHAILQRMRELAVQSSNGTYQDEDRAQIALEAQALKDEIDRIASSTHYNGIKLLNGTTGAEKLTKADEIVGADADNSAVAGSEAAIAEQLKELGFGFTTGAGTGSAKVTGTASIDAFLDSAKGQSATLIRKDEEMFLQIGDHTYKAELTDATATADTVFKTADGTAVTIKAGSAAYVFKDVDGNAVAVLNNSAANIDDIDTDLLETLTSAALGGTDDFVFSGIKLSSDSGRTVLLTGNSAVDSQGEAAIDKDHALYNAVSADNKSELVFQIGANGGLDQRVGLHVANMSTAALGLEDTKIFDISVKTREEANDAIEVLDAAINQVSAQRASLGALQNRLEHTLNNLGVTKENLTAAESTIRDVDMAKEMMEFTKNNILVQASQAMLAQANALPQGVLSLLR